MFRDAALAQLNGNKSLRKLDLSQTNVGDEGARVFSTLPKLSSLSLDGTRVTDRTLNEIAKMEMLDILSLEQTRVTENGVEKVLGLKHLGLIRLRGTAITPEFVNRMRTNTGKCTSFIRPLKKVRKFNLGASCATGVSASIALSRIY